MSELERLYDAHCKAGTAISPHLPTLRRLAEYCETIVEGGRAVEFGVKNGASSSALLLGLGNGGHLTSYDIVLTKQARQLQEIARGRWDYRIEDARSASVPPATLIFFDSLHTYDQVRAELRHVTNAARCLIFHDVSTFGEVGAEGETGRQSWTYVAGRGSVPAGHWGIRPAIDEFMIDNPSWRIAERSVESHGLLVLAR